MAPPNKKNQTNDTAPSPDEVTELKPCLFLDALPLEIRQEIYGLVCTYSGLLTWVGSSIKNRGDNKLSGQGPYDIRCSVFRRNEPSPERYTGFMAANGSTLRIPNLVLIDTTIFVLSRQIHTEAMETFHRHNDFRLFQCDSSRAARKDVKSGLSRPFYQSSSAIRSMTVEYIWGSLERPCFLFAYVVNMPGLRTAFIDCRDNASFVSAANKIITQTIAKGAQYTLDPPTIKITTSGPVVYCRVTKPRGFICLGDIREFNYGRDRDNLRSRTGSRWWEQDGEIFIDEEHN